MTAIIAAVGVLVGFYVLYCAVLYVMQSRFIYFPDSELIASPEEIGLVFESIYFPSMDEVKLHGWFVPAKNSRATVLLCHGNAGNISHRLDEIQVFNRLGLDVFVFDYRGYGLSEGKATELGTYYDAEGAWRFLTEVKKIPDKRIIIAGRSLGGAIAARLAEQKNPKALILESAFTSIPDIAGLYYSFVSVQLLSRYHYPTKLYVQNVNCPVLVIHSRDDELIPFSHGQELHRLAKPPKEFLTLSGSHNEGPIFSQDAYDSGLDGFISRHVRGFE